MLWLQLVIAAVLVAVVAALGTRGMVALMGRFAGGKISRVFADAEHIVDRHTIPPSWRERLRKRLRGVRPECADPRLSARHQARARRWSLRELERLLSFAKKTSIVADEESRRVFVAELEQVREEWLARGWDGMCAADTACRDTTLDPDRKD